MSKRILIDLARFRETAVNGEYCYGECSYDFHPNNTGMKDIIELAMLRFTCRHCEQAPCIKVCPVDALEKDEDGTLHRAINLCVSCQSCVAVCPFGTLSNGIITKLKNICDQCDFSDESQELLCMKTAPAGAIVFTDIEPDDQEHIYKLSERILVKEFLWEDLQRNE
ncbi:MAG: 4Fe-4S dicluster domain-containing protein [Candidatus Cloacimonadaceae bacterium]|nr:4Fe-4S dicluster domain-containing protein [Candidatus Cloacimonadaceae bacterium]